MPDYVLQLFTDDGEWVDRGDYSRLAEAVAAMTREAEQTGARCRVQSRQVIASSNDRDHIPDDEEGWKRL